jgi:hypothetical protein
MTPIIYTDEEEVVQGVVGLTRLLTNPPLGVQKPGRCHMSYICITIINISIPQVYLNNRHKYITITTLHTYTTPIYSIQKSGAAFWPRCGRCWTEIATKAQQVGVIYMYHNNRHNYTN